MTVNKFGRTGLAAIGAASLVLLSACNSEDGSDSSGGSDGDSVRQVVKSWADPCKTYDNLQPLVDFIDIDGINDGSDAWESSPIDGELGARCSGSPLIEHNEELGPERGYGARGKFYVDVSAYESDRTDLAERDHEKLLDQIDNFRSDDNYTSTDLSSSLGDDSAVVIIEQDDDSRRGYVFAGFRDGPTYYKVTVELDKDQGYTQAQTAAEYPDLPEYSWYDPNKSPEEYAYYDFTYDELGTFVLEDYLPGLRDIVNEEMES